MFEITARVAVITMAGFYFLWCFFQKFYGVVIVKGSVFIEFSGFLHKPSCSLDLFWEIKLIFEGFGEF